ncbi:MAG: hypothetical protein R3F11_20450 [Verrucomicrobiales bacterium]
MGTSVTVPADALFADGGARGGQVGIAPVPPDRLPGTLPPGLNFLVITADGRGDQLRRAGRRLLSQPADPMLSGETLTQGRARCGSLNHDSYRFEVIGPMTVSEDGWFVCTDPGVGTVAPGWHAQRFRGSKTEGGFVPEDFETSSIPACGPPSKTSRTWRARRAKKAMPISSSAS